MRVVAIAVCLLSLVTVTAARRAPGQLPVKFTNLQLLPKDVPSGVLVETMKQFTSGLGVRCEHCHVGEGNDLTKFDFAADTKPTKKTARAMMTMVATINQELLKDVGTPSPQPKVGCFTCHRGALKPPAMAPPAGRGRG